MNKTVELVMKMYPGLIEEIMVDGVSNTYFCDSRISEGKVYISYQDNKLFKIKSVYNPVQTENGLEVMAYVYMILYTKEEYGVNSVQISYMADTDTEYFLPEESCVALYNHGIEIFSKMDSNNRISETYSTYDKVGIMRRHTIDNIIKSQ